MTRSHIPGHHNRPPQLPGRTECIRTVAPTQRREIQKQMQKKKQTQHRLGRRTQCSRLRPNSPRPDSHDD